MSKYEMASLFVSALGFLVVALSLYYLARQTRLVGRQTEHVARSVQVATYSSVADQMLTIDSIFLQFPETRPYFYSGEMITSSDENYQRCRAIAEQLLDFFDSAAIMMGQENGVWPWEWWEEYIKDSFAFSPLLCKELVARRHWYRPELFRLMKDGEKRREIDLRSRAGFEECLAG